MHEDFELCRRAVQSHDARFDGWFFTGVVTTGIYCRPSCPVRPPKTSNMRFFPSSAAAQQGGFRACKRCRPDASPGSPEWNTRADVVARAMRLIADGIIEREGVEGLARHLGYGTRQIERHLKAEVGAGPLAIARAQRAQTARLLIETTDVPMIDVSDGAGFASLRSFNNTVNQVFETSPTELRKRAARGRVDSTPGVIDLRLPFRRPLFPDNLFGHLAATGVPGVEEWCNGWYRRALCVDDVRGIVELQPRHDHIACRLRIEGLQALNKVINRCRWLLDLDADPTAIDEHLAFDTHLAPLVQAAPGRRVPKTIDPNEFAVRAVLGQQVSTAAARTRAARLVVQHGEPIEDPNGGLTHVFPRIEALRQLDPTKLALPQSRRNTLTTLIDALANGAVDLRPGVDWNEARAQLAELPGMGPWTIETIAMRALGDPDAFLANDLGIVKAAKHLGLPAKGPALMHASEAWRPWRAYAVQHLWATGDHAVNTMPPTSETEKVS